MGTQFSSYFKKSKVHPINQNNDKAYYHLPILENNLDKSYRDVLEKRKKSSTVTIHINQQENE